MNAASDLSKLPFPVAHPLYWMRDPENKLDVAGRYANAILSCYQAMRLAALLMLADYLDSDEDPDPKVNAQIRGLRLPHWQEWTHLADALCRFWSDDKRQARFPRVVAGWRAVSQVTVKGRAPSSLEPWKELIRGFPGISGKRQASSANEVAWVLRNAEAHRAGAVTPGSRERQQAEFVRLEPLAKAIVSALFADPEFALLRTAPAEGGAAQLVRLVGAHPDLHFEREPAEPGDAAALAATSVAARLADEPLAIYPLLIPSEESESRAATGLLEPIEPAPMMHPGNSERTDPAPMMEAVSNSKIVVLGVDRSRELAGPPLEAVLAALSRKQVELALKRSETAPWKVVDWARMWARETLDQLTNTKYFPDFYLERPDLDGELEKYRAGSGKALLLLGEAGTGKSSLIARFADQLFGGEVASERAAAKVVLALEQAEDVVVLLSGRDAYGGTGGRAEESGEQLLADVVARRLGVRAGGFNSLRDLILHLERSGASDAASARLVWLLLDGINEADRFTHLVAALDSFLPTLAQAPRTRLIVSMRTGAFHALGVREAERGSHREVHAIPGFNHGDCFLKFPDAQNREVPWLDVRPFRLHAEGPRAYALRREKLPGRAAEVPYEQLSSSLKELLLRPLYLHLFHETFAGRSDAPRDFDEGRLLDAYLDGLAARGSTFAIAGAGSWLERLAETMVERRRAFLPIEEAENWAAEWRRRLGFSSVAQVCKLDPVEELVAASVLLRPAEIGSGSRRELAGYQFTQQKLAERLLLRHLDRELRVAGRSMPTRDDLAQWIAKAAAEPPFAELAGALAEWVARLTRAGEADAPQKLDALLDIGNDEVRKRLMAALIAASALAPPDPTTAILDHLARSAAGRSDGRDRFFLTALNAVAWLKDRAPLAASLRAWHVLLAFCESQSAGDPSNPKYQDDLSVCLHNIGAVFLAQGKLQDALHFFEKDLQIAEQLLSRTPGNPVLQVNVSVSCLKVGDVLVEQGRLPEALQFFERAAFLPETLVRLRPEPASFLQHLSIVNERLGDAYLRQNLLDAALRQYRLSLKRIRDLAQAHPTNTDSQRFLSVTLNKVGDVLFSKKEFIDALKHYDDSLAIRKGLTTADPANVLWLRDLAASHGKIGNLYLEEGNLDHALQSFRESITVLTMLVASDACNAAWQHDLLSSYRKLGDTLCARREWEQAIVFYQRSIAIGDTNSATAANSATWQHSLMLSEEHLGEALSALARHEEAAAAFGRALALAESLKSLKH